MAVQLDPIDVPREDVLKRVARYEDLDYNPERYPDSNRENNQRKVFAVLGPGLEVNNAKDALPAINIEEGFNISYVKATPGNGPALHVHDANETFIAANGRWKIIFGTNEQESLEVGQYDVISVPAFVPRRFVNITEGDPNQENLLIAVLAGNRPKAMFVEASLNA